MQQASGQAAEPGFEALVESISRTRPHKDLAHEYEEWHGRKSEVVEVGPPEGPYDAEEFRLKQGINTGEANGAQRQHDRLPKRK